MTDNIRPASARDASSIALISLEVWTSTYLREGVNAFFADYALSEFTSDKIAARLAAPDHRSWVCENANGIDGFVEICSNAQPPLPQCSDFELTRLYVQPRHKGKGKGAALLQYAIDHARTLGFASLWLAVNAENSAAIRFYQKLAFETVGNTHFRIGDQAYENYVMRLTF